MQWMDLKIVLLCTHYYCINGDRECNAANFKQSRFLPFRTDKIPRLFHYFYSHIPVFLPAANEVCEGYVFTGVCLSTPGGGGVRGCSGGAWFFPGRGACIGYDEIRSMSGRYASYWNAFLFMFCFLTKHFSHFRK